MVLKDFVIGQIYSMDILGVVYTFRVNRLDRTHAKGAYINNVIYIYVKGDAILVSEDDLIIRNCRLATYTDAEHFKKCERAGTYIPFEQVVLENSYLIY